MAWEEKYPGQWGGSISRSYTICVTCRKAWRGSPTCKHETIRMHYSWRPPKKRDTKAWDRIAKGDYFTEKSELDHRSREALPPKDSQRFKQYWGTSRFNLKFITLKGRKNWK